MTTQHEDAMGKYFWTRHKVTAVYEVIEQRRAGSAKISYWLSTGKNIKASFSNLFDAVKEAKRRQEFIDAM